jgi:uncharacterized BrkB/YihY/UPF0761 family membrane protein
LVWLGVVAIAGLVTCGLWALGDHLRARMLRERFDDSTRRDAPRSMVGRRLLLAVIVVATTLVVVLTVLLVVFELRG